jgi:hypothetical protein
MANDENRPIRYLPIVRGEGKGVGVMSEERQWLQTGSIPKCPVCFHPEHGVTRCCVEVDGPCGCSIPTVSTGPEGQTVEPATLKPCPFCGGSPYPYEVVPSTFCEGENCSNKTLIPVKEWNARPIEDALSGQVKALQEELQVAKDEADKWKKPCRCGSGGHPRYCERHPEGYAEHIRLLNCVEL